MTRDEALALVEEVKRAEADTVHVEAKAARSALPQRIWQTLSAFANTPGGGILVLGLDEAKGFALAGVEHPKKIQQDLASVCDQMDPPLRPLIEIHDLGGKHLVTAEVGEVSTAQKPCSYKGAGLPNGAYIRVADGDRRLTAYEAQMLLAGRGQPREDERPVEGAGPEDLDGAIIRRYVARVRRRSPGRYRALSVESILREHKIVVHEGNRWIPSLAGILAFGKRPDRFLPALGATFVYYPGTRVGEPGPGGERFLDNPPAFQGSLVEIVPALLDRLRKNMKQRAIVRGLFRQDLWEYPETALREVLVNALVHRDYSGQSLGTPVQIQMFTDRLVVVNPGGLFGPVTLDRLGEPGVASARNATLMRLLQDVVVRGEDLSLCENRGSGIGAVLAALRGAGMSPPEFRDTISTFSVTFTNASLLDAETLRWLNELPVAGLSDAQRLGLALARRGRILDNPGYRNVTGIDSRLATQELGDLVEQGLLDQHGSRRWATYVLAASHRAPSRAGGPGARKRRRDRAEDFRRLLRGKTLSRRELEAATGLSPHNVRYWLRRLEKDGFIAVTTANRRSKAVRYRWKGRRGS